MIKLFTKKRKGFTLIELVVVIAILGILAAIAIPRFSKVTDSAKDKAAIADQRVVVSAVQMYQAQNNGALPGSDDDIKPFLEGNAIPSTVKVTYAAGSVTVEADSDTDTEIPDVVID